MWLPLDNANWNAAYTEIKHVYSMKFPTENWIFINIKNERFGTTFIFLGTNQLRHAVTRQDQEKLVFFYNPAMTSTKATIRFLRGLEDPPGKNLMNIFYFKTKNLKFQLLSSKRPQNQIETMKIGSVTKLKPDKKGYSGNYMAFLNQMKTRNKKNMIPTCSMKLKEETLSSIKLTSNPWTYASNTTIAKRQVSHFELHPELSYETLPEISYGRPFEITCESSSEIMSELSFESSYDLCFEISKISYEASYAVPFVLSLVILSEISWKLCFESFSEIFFESTSEPFAEISVISSSEILFKINFEIYYETSFETLSKLSNGISFEIIFEIPAGIIVLSYSPSSLYSELQDHHSVIKYSKANDHETKLLKHIFLIKFKSICIIQQNNLASKSSATIWWGNSNKEYG